MTTNEVTTGTDIEGGITAPVLSGTFTGEVHIASGPTVDAIAEKLLRDYGPPMANLKATMGTQQRLVELETRLDKRFEHEDEERVARQAETDAYRHSLEQRIQNIEASVNRSMWTAAGAALLGLTAWIRGETKG